MADSAFIPGCGCHPAYRLLISVAAKVTCRCGVDFKPFPERDDQLPSKPVACVWYPVAMHAGPYKFGKIVLKRQVLGSRTSGGRTEALCRYGARERWYSV